MSDLLLLLIRHAEQQTLTDADPSLSARGREQAERLAARLAGVGPTAVYSSPLARARETAAPIARLAALELAIDDDLAEIRTSHEHRARYSDGGAGRLMEPDASDYAASAVGAVRHIPRLPWPPSEAEDLVTFRTRTQAAVDRIVTREAGGVVVAVVHGGVLASVVGELVGGRGLWFVPWHTGITALWYGADGPVLLVVNDAAHLDGAHAPLEVMAAAARRQEAMDV